MAASRPAQSRQRLPGQHRRCLRTAALRWPNSSMNKLGEKENPASRESERKPGGHHHLPLYGRVSSSSRSSSRLREQRVRATAKSASQDAASGQLLCLQHQPMSPMLMPGRTAEEQYAEGMSCAMGAECLRNRRVTPSRLSATNVRSDRPTKDIRARMAAEGRANVERNRG